MFRSMVERLGRFDVRRRFFPHRIADKASFSRFVNHAVIDGYEPAEPFISKTTSIVTIGSCFAGNVSKFLGAAGYPVFHLPVSDRLFSPVALQMFTKKILLADAEDQELVDYWQISPPDIQTMRQTLRNGAVVIITLGLSTVWVFKKTGQMVFEPQKKYKTSEGIAVAHPDPSHFEMRQMSIEDILACITKTIDAIRTLSPSSKVILTLSPIPLAYSGSDYPLMAADCLSKSSLRVAIDQLMMTKAKDIYYFPSFELLKWAAPLVDKIWFEDNLISHIRNDWIAYTIAKFRQFYCLDESQEPQPPAP